MEVNPEPKAPPADRDPGAADAKESSSDFDDESSHSTRKPNEKEILRQKLEQLKEKL